MDRAPNYEDCNSFNLSVDGKIGDPAKCMPAFHSIVRELKSQSRSGGHIQKCLGGSAVKCFGVLNLHIN